MVENHCLTGISETAVREFGTDHETGRPGLTAGCLQNRVDPVEKYSDCQVVVWC